MNKVFDIDEQKLVNKLHRIRNWMIVISILFLAVFVLDLVFMNRTNTVYHIVFGVVLALAYSIAIVHLGFTTYSRTHNYLLLERNNKLAGSPREVKCLEISEDEYFRNHVTFKRIKFLANNKDIIELDVYVSKTKDFEVNKEYLISSYNSILYSYKENK